MKVYISCPVTVSKQTLQGTIRKVKAEGGDEAYWDRDNPNHYLKRWVKDCEVFVIVLPKNKFEIVVNNLPAGCKREIIEAYNLGKTILLSYKNRDGETNLYRIDKTDLQLGNKIRGTAGTTPALHNHVIDDLDRRNKEISMVVNDPSSVTMSEVERQIEMIDRLVAKEEAERISNLNFRLPEEWVVKVEKGDENLIDYRLSKGLTSSEVNNIFTYKYMNNEGWGFVRPEGMTVITKEQFLKYVLKLPTDTNPCKKIPIQEGRRSAVVQDIKDDIIILGDAYDRRLLLMLG